VLYLGICHVWHSRNSSQIGVFLEDLPRLALQRLVSDRHPARRITAAALATMGTSSRFLEANGDGKRTGDKDISGVTVELIRDGKVIATTVTKKMGLTPLTNCLLESTL